jgi:hypothetical protein
MVGRGELGFVMAEKAYRTDLTSKLTFSVTVWALLIATILSPICFRRSVGSYGVHSDPHAAAEEKSVEVQVVSTGSTHQPSQI